MEQLIQEYILGNRFSYSMIQTKEALKQIENYSNEYESSIEAIRKEDMLLKIKYRSFKKSLIWFGISSLFITIGALTGFSIMLVLSLIVWTSGLWGLYANKLNKQKRAYISKASNL